MMCSNLTTRPSLVRTPFVAHRYGVEGWTGRPPLSSPSTATVARDTLAALFAELARCASGVEVRQRVGLHQRAVVEELLAEHDVVALFSPPYWPPRYNGSVPRQGSGSLKDRTEACAARAGRAGQWTWDDVAGACAEANALSRPRGASGASPDELWSARRPIAAEERAAFGSAVGRGWPNSGGGCGVLCGKSNGGNFGARDGSGSHPPRTRAVRVPSLQEEVNSPTTLTPKNGHLYQ